MSTAVFEQERERGLTEVYQRFFPGQRRNSALDKHVTEVCERVFPGAAPTLLGYEMGAQEALPDSVPAPQPQDYAGAKAQTEAQAAAAARDARNREVWVRDILPRYDVLDNEANLRLAVDYANGELSLAKFEFYVANGQGSTELLFGDERQKLLDEIRERLTDPYGRRLNSFDLETWMKKYALYDRMQLRAELQKIIDRQTTAAKPLHQIKAELAAVRKAQQDAMHGYAAPDGLYPRLLSTTVPKFAVPERGWDTIRAVPTGELLRWYAKRDLESFKRFCRLYSTSQVNFWLNQP